MNTSYPSLPQAWIIFAIYLAASIALGLLVGLINEFAGIENMSPGNFVAYNVSMLFIIWFSFRNIRNKTERTFHFKRIHPSLYFLLPVLTIALAVLLDPLTNLIPVPDLVQQVFDMLATRDLWTFLMVGITGPILEELLFRGIILDGFLKRYSPGKAIFWSAFLFGLFHLNPWQFIPGFLIGLLLGYIYFKTRSLTTAILIHIVNNSFSYMILYIYGKDVNSFADIFAEKSDYQYFIAAGSLIFVASLYLLYRIIHKNRISWTSDLKTGSS